MEKSSNCELKTNNRIEWIVSGMTMNFSKIKETKFSELIIKLTKSYLIPYFYLNLISFPIWQLYITQSGSDVPIVETLFGVLYSNDFYIKMISGWTWFMTTLFLCHVILISLIKIFDDNKQIFFASLLLGVIAYLDKENVRPWHFDGAFFIILIFVKLPTIKLINFMGKNTLLYLTVPHRSFLII